MDFSISSTTKLLPRGSELSACSWWTYLISGEKVSTGLTLLCLCWNSRASLSGRGCCIPVGSYSSLTASASLSLPLFFNPFVIPVIFSGDVRG